MKSNTLISTQILCEQYNIKISFVDKLHKMGFIKIKIIEQNSFVHQDQIYDLEKTLRLYNELNLNLEGIDVVFNLLAKEKQLQQEINILKNKLRFYEKD